MSHNSLMAKTFHMALLLAILISRRIDFTSSKPTGFSMKIIPRDLPESPLYPGNLTDAQRLERWLGFSEGRAQYLKQKISLLGRSPKNATSSTNDAKLTLLKMSYFYIAMMTIGTPPTLVFLLMDTGGGLVWTQCQPCVSCYPQTMPIFDSRDSSSFKKLPCSHFLCNGGASARFQCVENQCVYRKTYGGGGPTRGVASLETLRFERLGGAVQEVNDIVFGCSNDNSNFHEFTNTPISGIMGLSWAPDSLMTQLMDYTHKRFSYCFTPFNEDHGTSLLTFGDAVPQLQEPVRVTRFLMPYSGSGSYFFYLNLVDISVGSDKLGFPSSIFWPVDDGTGGFLIDSGSPYSFLVDRFFPEGRNPYKEVIGSFERKYEAFGLKKLDKLPGVLCFELPKEFKDFLSITYHFDGADFVVDGKFTNYINRQEGYFCVTLLAHTDLAVLGAFHQQNKRIVYDGNVPAMQFSDEICN